MIPQRRTRKYDEEMCFWLGLDYDRREPPRPIDRKVDIKELDEMTIYVRYTKKLFIVLKLKRYLNLLGFIFKNSNSIYF